jgi:hypothetical protein
VIPLHVSGITPRDFNILLVTVRLSILLIVYDIVPALRVSHKGTLFTGLFELVIEFGEGVKSLYFIDLSLQMLSYVREAILILFDTLLSPIEPLSVLLLFSLLISSVNNLGLLGAFH